MTNDFLESMLGRTVPGGCDDCDAEQELATDPTTPGIYRLQIRHDETCPTYRHITHARRST